eukprot:TRINITY_DN8495_c0_g1_i2.p1 TRINITY_DN8495_c0_g1~~TRINITY_DN8495_c0_g1_i2.p1  ORF type:complete len:203 (+),score=41.34 TRINITY_DN8495_c0_g1_i2:86-694(+)
MNIRYFEASPIPTEENKSPDTIWWLGGGIDLTPYYPQKSQIIGFHKGLKSHCDRYGIDYETYKKQCDEYFFLKHRGEARGVGGIFFDHLKDEPKSRSFSFVLQLGYQFQPIYAPILDANRDIEYTERQREFQLLRRSRYVEFNLVWDRGTKFGLQSEGRIESILMSLPMVAKWKYDYKPEEGSEEETTIKFYLQAQDWVNMD